MLSTAHVADTDDIQQAAHRTRRRRKTLAHTCHHCDRTFKRSEHLERHVRTHTKEKPFICRCGAAFARRDLLTRHQRLTFHVGGAEGPAPDTEAASSPRGAAPDIEAAAAAAAAESLSSLSGLNAPLWDHPSGAEAYMDAHHVTHRNLAHADGVAQPYDQSLLAPQIFSQGNGVHDFDAHFREFADFLDGVGLPAEWSPYFQVPDREDDLVDPMLREPEEARHEHATSAPGTQPGTPFSSWLPSAPAGNHISGTRTNENAGGRREVASPLFKITDEQRARLDQLLDTFRHVLDPDFKLPSRHALTRYVTSYFEGFHTHMVFIHTHTWAPLDTPLELILSIATIGAQYCFEHRIAEHLFHAGRAILVERLRHEGDKFGPKTRSLLNMRQDQTPHGSVYMRQETRMHRNLTDWGPWEPIDTVRALINLMGYATWEPKEWLLQEAFSLQSLLAQVLRDLGLEEGSEPEPSITDAPSQQETWLAWVRQESIRRTKLIAFSFIHIHSVAYNVYPVLRSNELHLRLP